MDGARAGVGVGPDPVRVPRGDRAHPRQRVRADQSGHRTGHDGALGQRRPQHAQRDPGVGQGVRERQPQAGEVVRPHLRGRRRVRLLLHAARHAHQGSARAARGRRRHHAHADHPCGRRRRDSSRLQGLGPDHPGPGRFEDHPGRGRQSQARRSRARVAGGLPGVGHGHDRRRRDPGRRSQPDHPRRAVPPGERRVRRRRRRCGGGEHDGAELHRERVLLERRARLPRVVPRPRTATATTASTRTTRSTGSSTTRTRRAVRTRASTSASATRAMQ